MIFVIPIIFFFDIGNNVSIKRKITIFFSIFIIGGLFYLPVWFDNSFKLDWITAARPLEQGFFGLFARFALKSWDAIGYLQFFLILYGLKNLNIFFHKKDKPLIVLILLIIFNLLLFLYIPAELSYLQPAIIFLYLIIIKKFKKSLLVSLIILNFINWSVNVQFLNITHKDNTMCGPKHAIDASIDLRFVSGAVYKFLDSRKMIKCWIHEEDERSKRILEGKSIKIYN